MKNEKRYIKRILTLSEAIYICDTSGYVSLYNKAAALLWGREPLIGKDMYCGCVKIVNRDGTELPLENYPMIINQKDSSPVQGEEIIIQRPDGSLRHILHYASPLFDATGSFAGTVNMQIDITDKKKKEIQENENHLNVFN
jgi:PAS domain S-box-containing protein